MVRQPSRALDEWVIKDGDGRAVGIVQQQRRGLLELGYQAAQNPKVFRTTDAVVG
jgi:hypothetical protein